MFRPGDVWSTWRTALHCLFILAASCLLPPGSIAAQTGAARPASADRAAALLARADLLSREDQLLEKARLYEEAARLFPSGDARASASLRRAAQILHHLNQSARSLVLLEQAAELAAARGDLTEAANFYVDALFIALEIHARSKARRFIDRALALANSPAMPEADRQRILRAISRQSSPLRNLHAHAQTAARISSA
jgi:hypothetical protein